MSVWQGVRTALGRGISANAASSQTVHLIRGHGLQEAAPQSDAWKAFTNPKTAGSHPCPAMHLPRWAVQGALVVLTWFPRLAPPGGGWAVRRDVGPHAWGSVLGDRSAAGLRGCHPQEHSLLGPAWGMDSPQGLPAFRSLVSFLLLGRAPGWGRGSCPHVQP